MKSNLQAVEKIAVSDLTALIKLNLFALWEENEEMAKAIPPVMIWGAPGVGKSTAIRELANELDIGFIDVRLAQREPVDMRGLPVPDGEQVRWLVSSEWPRDPESRGIIIFDELTAADKTLQVAAYEFILDRRLGDLYKVPKNWYIVAAGNRTEDRAVACSMSSALANRFLHVEVAPQLRDFITYGESHGMHPVVLDFLRFRPKLLFSQKQENLQRGWPSPRSWERVSTMLKIADQTGN
ncbi:MAG: ATP-binding protein, partial [Lentisphaeria bacterium]|nr:ATP-binding protein [Lentisphaeria bacterium]